MAVAVFHVGQTTYLYQGSGNLELLIHPQIETNPVSIALSWAYAVLFCGGTVPPMVLFFFVLSGFVLTSSLMKEVSPTIKTGVAFFGGRIFRILPAVIFTVSVFCLIYFSLNLRLYAPEVYTVPNIIRSFILFDVRIDGVMWSLQVEWFGTFAIFFAYLIAIYGGRSTVLVLCSILAALSLFDAVIHFATFGGRISRVAYLHTFIFGAIAYHFGATWWAGANKWVQGVALATAVVVFFLAMPIAAGTFQPEFGSSSSLGIILQALCAAVAISIMAFGDLRLTMLDWRITRFYGKISYSFYLLHPVALTVIWAHRDPTSTMPYVLWKIVEFGVPAPLLAIALAVISVVAVTPLAYLCWRYVETTGIRLGSRFRASLRTSGAVPRQGHGAQPGAIDAVIEMPALPTAGRPMLGTSEGGRPSA